MKKNIGKYAAGTLLAAMLAGSSMTVWAGEWIQLDNGSWMYEQEEGYAYGWQQIDGYWNYLDAGTGIWSAKPAITDDAASHLLWNALKKAGLYQNEGAELICKVVYSDKSKVTVSVGTETGPNGFAVLNNFDVNRKDGTAKSNYSKTTFNLWE
ncbi:MAG: hypothetical protein ACRDBO_18590 [Lachnospiraceae bacterium]